MTLLIYLFPAMMDLVVGSSLFVASVRLAADNASPVAVTTVLALNSVSYLLATQFMGWIVTEKNAGNIITLSSLCSACFSILFIVFPGFLCLYFFVMIQAFAMAGFFVPFQIFMKKVEGGKGQGIIKSTALYTLAWSGGMAMGPFVAGYLWEATAWQWCFVLNSLMALLTAAGVFYINKTVLEKRNQIVRQDEASGEIEPYSKMPNLVRVSWLFGGLACLVWISIRAYFPSTGNHVEMPKAAQGEVLGLLLGAQAITGLCFYRSKTWMYRVGPMFFFGVLGVLGVFCFALQKAFIWYYLGALLLGIYAGAFFFYFVFHAISHPTRSARYVSINEGVIGTVGLIGPFIAGLLATKVSPEFPYYVGALLMAIVVFSQALVHRRYIPAVKELRWTLSRVSSVN
ncbi:MAG: MFS transporter [Lentisphaerae bacterium]|nr:MFS transporter [Lentisphaerota bacterium]